MVDIEIIVVIGNTLVIAATFIATLYRIKIERDQIKVVKQDVEAKESLDKLRKYVKAERESLASMNKDEWKDFLDYLQKLGEC
jgi:short-subunit dehydrogenase involved in D-alanine esterification of teichoic acids